MRDWLDTLKGHGDAGASVVLVTVVAAKGSVPRPVGTRMIVTLDAIDGTIGGGLLEHKAIAIARDLLADGAAAKIDRSPQRFTLGASLGQSCGGVALLSFEPVKPKAGWIDALLQARAGGAPCALVTPLQGSGDQHLIVTADACVGTLGAVGMDGDAASVARTMIEAREAPRSVTPSFGGDVEVFVDILRPDDFHIVLFGAGHVGRALVNALAAIRCRITWVDAREGVFPAEVPGHVDCIVTEAPEAEVGDAPAGAYFLVMTHSHPQDEALAERILARNDSAYFGLIGSVSKRRQFERQMEARGMPRSRFAAMTCPIGIAGITGKEPEVIAIAVAAELLQIRSARTAEGAQGESRCA